ncbi:hypothetical protein ZIOFF_032691 [Zingiber officinale]|uniref:PPIase cyclophilin-type domain-containing protein n=1 Tax=Zingiber officinale TaxID=94328 RepID=A0A8J5L1F1_ZINOF|nr:hypothetical protein ZIOFF_032691 [Zingiber officinale]
MATKKNPVVFLEISVDGKPPERMDIELFADVVPKIAENFRALCTGIGGESIYGRKFPDENFKLKHAGPGFLSLASSAPNSNGSQFFITFRATPELDGKNVVFGKVLSSSALLKKIEHAGTEKGKPLYMVKIVDCGEVSAGKIQVAARKEKEKLRKASSDSSSSDSSGGEQRSSISSSDSESGSTSNSSSGGEKPSPHDNIKNFKQSPQHTDISAKNDGRKQSLPAASVKPIATGNASKSERIVDPDGNASHEAGHVSKEKRDYPDVTNHSIEKFNERTKKPPNSSERSRKSRSPIKPKEYSIGSRGALPSMERTSSLTRAQHSGDADRSLDRGISRRSKSHSRSPRRELDSSKKPSPTGPPKRIRKGRGFSEQYAYVRKYRTPSPEHSPIRSHYYRARYELGRERNRYPRRPFYADRSPVRRYRGSPRGNSPPGLFYGVVETIAEKTNVLYLLYQRKNICTDWLELVILEKPYRTRRDRSRSLSRSPIRGRQRDRSQSRRQSRSPLDRQKPAPSSQLESRLGPQGHDFRFAREQSRSKSPSLSKFRSDAGRACTADKGRSRSTSKSSSPNAANGLVAYGDGSPNK